MSEHTKEPWSYELDTGSDLRIYSETNPGIVDGCGCCGSPNCDDADARRIVACINACAGFDTELLENILMLGDTLKRRFKTLTDSESELQKQRDELLAALELIIERFGHCQNDYAFSKRIALDKARTAIAAVKGTET
jgi:hypothetical protein